MRRAFYFIHVAKTGGTAICYALGIQHGPHPLASTAPHGVFSFAMVRNPYDRLQSAFHFARDALKETMLQGVSFCEFVLDGPALAWQPALFQPMCEQLDAPVGYIGRFEQLERCFSQVCTQIGINRPPRLPVRYRTVNKEPYSHEMRSAVRERYAKDFTRFGYDCLRVA